MNLKEKVSSFSFKAWIKDNSQSIFFLSLLVIIAYVNSLGNQFVSDDVHGIWQNKNLDNFSTAMSRNPLSLRVFSLFVIKKIFGNNPFAFRLVNIFFHLGTTLSLYLLISLLINPQTAFIASAILAVHPLQTEAVTWISGGSYVQYSFFVFTSLLLYLLSRKKKKYYIFSLISFILALGFSEKAIVYPIILLALIISFFDLKKQWKKTIPFFILAALFTATLVIRIPQRLTSLQPSVQDTTQKQLSNPLIQIPVAVASYLKLIVWPKALTLYHSEMFFSMAQYVIFLILTIIFFALIAYFFFKNKKIFFFLSLFIISLLPTMTPWKISWIVAERYVYLGAIGIYAAVAILLNRLLKKPSSTRHGRGGKQYIWPLFIIVLLLLTIRTIVRNTDWKNQDRLWLSAAKTSPNSAQNNNNLGDLYARRGEFDLAINYFNKAITIRPGYASAHHNLANVYLRTNQLDQAEANYQLAIEYNPNLWQSYQALASIYYQQRDKDKAKQFLQKALEIDPENKQLKEAIDTIDQALQPTTP
jgi:tetratricopeptide (TPR) repeat protein